MIRDLDVGLRPAKAKRNKLKQNRCAAEIEAWVIQQSSTKNGLGWGLWCVNRGRAHLR